MIFVKTTEEIKIMRQTGKLLAQVIKKLSRQVKPGVSTMELDQLAEKLIRQAGAEPAFKGYRPDTARNINISKYQNGYPATICASINDEVVHGIPSAGRILQEGDIIGLDCGIKYKGYYSDMAETVAVDKISPRAKRLIEVTKKSLDRAIKKIKPGIHLGDVSFATQQYVESRGFSIVRSMTGHGIGQRLHEEPTIFNFGRPGTGPILKEGMTLAIEPMVNAGDWQVKTAEDGWTIKTLDGGLSAHFEHTVLVSKKGAEILTK